MAGEHFIEALVPTRHLLGLQYRNVVALECTVANLQAQRIKNNYSIYCRNRKKRNVPIIFFKTISVQLKKKLVMLHDFNLCGRSIISHNSKGVLGPHFARVVTAVGPHILTQGPNVWSTLTEIQRNIQK